MRCVPYREERKGESSSVIHFWYAFWMQHCCKESTFLRMIHCLFIGKWHFFTVNILFCASIKHYEWGRKKSFYMKYEYLVTYTERNASTLSSRSIGNRNKISWAANRLSLSVVFLFSTMNFSKCIYFTFLFQFLRSFELNAYNVHLQSSARCAQNINF